MTTATETAHVRDLLDGLTPACAVDDMLEREGQCGDTATHLVWLIDRTDGEPTNKIPMCRPHVAIARAHNKTCPFCRGNFRFASEPI
ncbi:hypothetical protein [uncultured Jatrophihabitans sp.]|uniref:hypothetical protein n=1 Tax=uncultured Jatrophihabitans sp. TaxID=1610747 RepID=UPI0035C9DC6D